MSLLFFSPTRPQRSKSSTMRSSRFGSFSSAERLGAFFLAHFDFGLRGLQRLADLLGLQLFERQEHPPHVLAG